MELANLEVYERQPPPNVLLGITIYGVIGNTYNTPSYEEALLLTFDKFVCDSAYDFLLKGRKR